MRRAYAGEAEEFLRGEGEEHVGLEGDAGEHGEGALVELAALGKGLRQDGDEDQRPRVDEGQQAEEHRAGEELLAHDQRVDRRQHQAVLPEGEHLLAVEVDLGERRPP